MELSFKSSSSISDNDIKKIMIIDVSYFEVSKSDFVSQNLIWVQIKFRSSRSKIQNIKEGTTSHNCTHNLKLLMFISAAISRQFRWVYPAYGVGSYVQIAEAATSTWPNIRDLLVNDSTTVRQYQSTLELYQIGWTEWRRAVASIHLASPPPAWPLVRRRQSTVCAGYTVLCSLRVCPLLYVFATPRTTVPQQTTLYLVLRSSSQWGSSRYSAKLGVLNRPVACRPRSSERRGAATLHVMSVRVLVILVYGRKKPSEEGRTSALPSQRLNI